MRCKTLLLFSGGIDSTVLAGKLKRDGVSFRALVVSTTPISEEVWTAKRMAHQLNLELDVFDASAIEEMVANNGMSFSVGGSISGPACMYPGGMPAPHSTAVLHALAEMYALCHGFDSILWAVHLDDVPNPDELREYLRRRAELSVFNSDRRMVIETPFLSVTKRDVVMLGRQLDLPLDQTRSCSVKSGEVCGECSQCLARRQVMDETPVLPTWPEETVLVS